MCPCCGGPGGVVLPTVSPGARAGAGAGVGSVYARPGRPGQQVVVVERVLEGSVGVVGLEDTAVALAAGAEAGDGAVGC